MKKMIWLLIGCLAIAGQSMAKEYPLSSPNGNNVMQVTCAGNIGFTLWNNKIQVLSVNNLRLHVKDKATAGQDAIVLKTIYSKGDEMLKVVAPVKFSTIRDHYNQMEIIFKGNYSLVFRAYDNGVAYRFVTRFKDDSVWVNKEEMSFDVKEASNAIWPYEAEKHENPFLSHFEYLFKNIPYQKIDSTIAGLPVYFTAGNQSKIVFTEADLFDYPNLFLQNNGQQLQAVLPHVIAKQQRVRDRGVKILEEADYIAKTTGNRQYPWRLWMINNDDAGLLTNTLVYQLATPSVIKNTDWIKPGKIAWDWWNANNLYGVDFKSGINNTTYKYYIDFASKFGLQYIILDEGWTKTTLDVMHPNPNIDIPELVAYGKKKNVDIILWVLWNPLDENMDAILDLYKSWGVKGIKVDFMARAEQYMVNFFTRTAMACAKRELLADLHGAYKPTGLHRTYPNVLSFESVHGLENDKWDTTITPTHDATIPFTRMMAGPMDFTPGAMRNAVKGNFNAVYTQPMSQGTRAHQTALYIVFESPLQMLADNPSSYLMDEKYTGYVAQIPTTWEDMKVLYADAGKAVIIARKHGDKWYIGGITNWDPFQKEVSLDFLGTGDYQAEILSDGINANRVGEDYRITTVPVNKLSTLKINMASGGGFTAVITAK
ncbi:MAG TPA: glycoside hydrolase family 97 catalytic domain-containing protein [Hanamia sp.]|nr:glycoside hydrolase family 97 catalytic domain-containing protein [Hanamia sp.]